MNELIIIFSIYGLSVIFSLFVLRAANELVINTPEAMFPISMAFAPIANFILSIGLTVFYPEIFVTPFLDWFYSGKRPKIPVYPPDCNPKDDFGGRY